MLTSPFSNEDDHSRCTRAGFLALPLLLALSCSSGSSSANRPGQAAAGDGADRQEEGGKKEGGQDNGAAGTENALGRGGQGGKQGGNTAGSGALGRGGAQGAGANSSKAGTSADNALDTTPFIDPNVDPPIVPKAEDADTPKRPKRCDDAGHCSCMNIATLGKLGTWGGDTDRFETWMNGMSSAHVDVFKDHVRITPELLSRYDIFILEGLEDTDSGWCPCWTFEPEEIQALSDWVKAGGGLISLIGFGGDTGEINPANQILEAISGMSYGTDDIMGDCNANSACYCWGNPTTVSEWRSDTDIGRAISWHITLMPGYHGRPLNPGNATVVATYGDTNGKEYVVAAGKVVGNGHVFAYSDEWLTYTSEWDGTGQDQKSEVNPYETTCYDPATDSMKTADKVFQVAQFWYNVINWASTAPCPFVLDPTKVPNVVPIVH